MKKRRFSRLAISAAVFALVMTLFATWLTRFSRESDRLQRQTLEDALHRNLLLCYSLEGRYPDTLAELLEKYPLTYDRERFVIDYRLHGGNLLPEITILEIPR